MHSVPSIIHPIVYNGMDYAKHRMHSTFQNLKKAYSYVCEDIKGSYSNLYTDNNSANKRRSSYTALDSYPLQVLKGQV